jgi:hypothetical protein
MWLLSPGGCLPEDAEQELESQKGPPKRGTPKDTLDFGRPLGPIFILEFGGPWCQNPPLGGPGPFPHKSFFGAQISNPNGAAKRPHFGSRFLPQRRICLRNGPRPPRGGFGHQGPPNSRIKIGPRGPPKIECILGGPSFWGSLLGLQDPESCLIRRRGHTLPS